MLRREEDCGTGKREEAGLLQNHWWWMRLSFLVPPIPIVFVG